MKMNIEININLDKETDMDMDIRVDIGINIGTYRGMGVCIPGTGIYACIDRRRETKFTQHMDRDTGVHIGDIDADRRIDRHK